MNRFLSIFILMLISVILVNNLLAQDRGALTNVYASWFQASTTQTTIELPYPSRDVWIRNGSSVDTLCVSPSGAGISTGNNSGLGACRSNDDSFVFQLNGNEDIYLYDFKTTSITARVGSSTASPIMVVVTY